MIIMPQGTPTIKAARTRALGAEVILMGEDFAQASAEIPRLVAETGKAFIHPFDDDRVIARQGTIAIEMLEEGRDLDTIVVAVGGGGLISGMAVAARALAPEIEIIGVQSAPFPCK